MRHCAAVGVCDDERFVIGGTGGEQKYSETYANMEEMMSHDGLMSFEQAV